MIASWPMNTDDLDVQDDNVSDHAANHGTTNTVRKSPLARLKEISGRRGQSASPVTADPLASGSNQ